MSSSPSIFTRIVKGEIPSFKIAESADYYAFLDIRPLAKGPTLVIPKREEDYLFDLEDTEISDAGFLLFAGSILEHCQTNGIRHMMLF